MEFRLPSARLLFSHRAHAIDWISRKVQLVFGPVQLIRYAPPQRPVADSVAGTLAICWNDSIACRDFLGLLMPRWASSTGDRGRKMKRQRRKTVLWSFGKTSSSRTIESVVEEKHACPLL